MQQVVLMMIVLFALLMPDYPTQAETPSAAVQQQQAIDSIEEARAHFRSTGDIQAMHPDLNKAEQTLLGVYDGFVKRNEGQLAALNRLKVGDVLRHQAAVLLSARKPAEARERFERAIKYYEESMNWAIKIDDPAVKARARIGQARAELSLKQFGDAKAHSSEAKATGEQLHDPDLLFEALTVAAEVHVDSLDLVGGSDLLHRALMLVSQLQNRVLLYPFYIDLGGLYLSQAETCDYKHEIEDIAFCEQALERATASYENLYKIAEESEARGFMAFAKNFLERVNGRRRLVEMQKSSQEIMDRMNVLFHPREASDVVVSQNFLPGKGELPTGLVTAASEYQGQGGAGTFFIRGQLAFMSGDNKGAVQAYERATELLETDRRNLRDDRDRGSYLEDKVNFYYYPLMHYLHEANYDKAFAMMEQSRSRTMIDLLSSKAITLNTPATSKRFAEWVETKARIAQLQAELYERRGMTTQVSESPRIADYERELGHQQDAYARIITELGQEAPGVLNLVSGKSISLPAYQADVAARNGCDVLYYLVIDHGVFIWHITGQDVHVYNVFLPRAQLSNKIKALRDSLITPNGSFNTVIARELFLFLIEPVRQALTSTHLVIIPHESLHYVPFETLVDPKGKYLAEMYDVSYAPNATLDARFELVGPLQHMSVLGIADPTLPGAVEEVMKIESLPGFTRKKIIPTLISKSELKEEAPKYEILHLATHGTFDGKEPLLSNLALQGANDEAQELTAAEMFGLPLEKTLLLVLSACSTGQVQATHANELLGMIRALLYAGAHSLILSEWQVNSSSTGMWMQAFYEAATSEPLRRAAQRAAAVVRADPRYSHPHFWAPFVFIGR